MCAAQAGTAAAYTVVYQHGTRGSASITQDANTNSSAGAQCNYGPENYSNWAYLKSISVRAPSVRAYNATSKRDHGLVSWQFALQRSTVPNPQTWTTVKKSSVQKATAYDDTNAPLSRLTVAYDLEAKDPNHQNGNQIFRTLVTIKWYRADGSVQGTVRLPSYYFNNDPMSQRTFPDWCQGVSTTG